MYKLTLTAEERKAIDWIGNRYGHGDDLYRILWLECICRRSDNGKVAGIEPDEWNDDCDIEFTIPEHAALGIKKIAEDDGWDWTCFDEKLASKFNTLCFQVI